MTSSGDHAELVALLPKLRRYAHGLVRGADGAEDLVQDTVLKALAKWHLFRPGTDLRAWLFTIMHNEFVNARRRETRTVPIAAASEGQPDRAGRDDPSIGLKVRDVERALMRLPKAQRDAVLLAALTDLNYVELAAELSERQIVDAALHAERYGLGPTAGRPFARTDSSAIPVGTIRSRLHRGHAALRAADIL